MTEPVVTEGKEAYLRAQKKRNLFIGLGLLAFVALVFFISMARMAQNIRTEAEKTAASRAASASH